MTETDHDDNAIAGFGEKLVVAKLNKRRSYPFDLRPDAAIRARIAAQLDLLELRKFRFHGSLQPLGRHDWALEASLGATVVQPCAITLDPVTTRIDERVQRHFIADLPAPEGLEVEMPEDDSEEPLGTVIDLGAIALEALALALPAFVRKPDAAFGMEGQMAADPKGAEPLDEARPKPFAALAALRDKLDKDGTPQ